MFSKVLLFLIIAASLCLLISPTSALMQSQSQELHLELFDPRGSSDPQSQAAPGSAEVVDPLTQSMQPIGIAVFDPRVPESSRSRTGAQQGDAPAAASDMRISQIYTRGGEAGATYQQDFVEIFNAGTTTVDINGWGLIVNTFEGTTQQLIGVRYTDRKS